MTKQYTVTVNGTAYEVTVESVSGGRMASAPVARTGETVSSPMPGTILDVKVAAGQAVKSGDILFILEAMKMENEIFAPCDGTVSSVAVSKGAAVNPGDVLCVIG